MVGLGISEPSTEGVEGRKGSKTPPSQVMTRFQGFLEVKFLWQNKNRNPTLSKLVQWYLSLFKKNVLLKIWTISSCVPKRMLRTSFHLPKGTPTYLMPPPPSRDIRGPNIRAPLTTIVLREDGWPKNPLPCRVAAGSLAPLDDEICWFVENAASYRWELCYFTPINGRK